MARVMVSVASFGGFVKSQTVDSIVGLERDGHEIIPGNVIGHDCQTARNEQAKLALAKGADYLFMVDWDIVLPKDALRNLLSHNVYICAGFYVRGKSDVGRTVIVKKGSHLYDDCYFTDEIAEMREAGNYLVPIKAAGTGCMLVSTRVFDTIPSPWFEFKPTEDFNFCDKVRYRGYTVHMDTRVGCGHIHDRLLEAM